MFVWLVTLKKKVKKSTDWKYCCSRKYLNTFYFWLCSCCCRLLITAERQWCLTLYLIIWLRPPADAKACCWSWAGLDSTTHTHTHITHPAERAHTAVITVLPQLQEVGRLWVGVVENYTAGGEGRHTEGSSKTNQPRATTGPNYWVNTTNDEAALCWLCERNTLTSLPYQPKSGLEVKKCRCAAVHKPPTMLLSNDTCRVRHRL